MLAGPVIPAARSDWVGPTTAVSRTKLGLVLSSMEPCGDQVGRFFVAKSPLTDAYVIGWKVTPLAGW